MLSLQSAQIVKQERAEVVQEGLRVFFWELTKHCIEQNVTSNRIFNIDETGFSQNSKARKVGAVHGSKNAKGQRPCST